MQEWQKLNDVMDNMLRETVARGDTVAPGWRDEVRAVVRDMLAAERERSAALCEGVREAADHAARDGHRKAGAMAAAASCAKLIRA